MKNKEQEKRARELKTEIANELMKYKEHIPAQLLTEVIFILSSNHTKQEVDRATKECTEAYAGLLDVIEADNVTIKSLEAKVEFLKSKGLTIGMMKTSDKPEPYMVYVIKDGSELCDNRTLEKLLDAELELTKFKEVVEYAEHSQDCSKQVHSLSAECSCGLQDKLTNLNK